MPETPDPFTRVHQALEQYLKPALQDEGLKLGNWIDQTTDPPAKVNRANRSPNDQLNASIRQGAFTLMPFGKNSKCAFIRQAYVLMLGTGSVNVVKLNRLKFATLRGLKRAGPSLGLPGLVSSFSIDNASDTDRRATSITNGSTAALTINVEMYVPNASLA